MKKKIGKEEKRKLKEKKTIFYFVKKKEQKKQVYISKKMLKNKYRNSQTFTNADAVSDDGVIKLKTGEYARVYSVDAIDLSLTSNTQKSNFFNQLKFLYQLRDLNLRIYKLDDMIDLNENKDYYSKLIEEFINDENKVAFLKERCERLDILEREHLTTTSRYYFVIISDNDKALEHISEEVEIQCYNMTPRLNIQKITNKLEIYQFLVNLYLTNASIEQIMWSDLVELVAPFFVNENMNYLKVDEEEVQVVTIKKIPPFIDELFFEELFNVPDTRSCIHIKDTIPTDKNYEVSMICNNGASGEWDYESWGPIINNLTDTRTKCNILFTKKYREEVLNGMDPVIANGLIPVTIENDGTVKKADTNQEWYRYANQKWANAVILEDEAQVYQNGETIPESNIESYFVWIPKYRYKLWDLGNYTELTSIQNKVQTIDVIFGDYDTKDEVDGECSTPGLSGESGTCQVGDYMTHPAFQSFGTKGLWVGKFETGYKGATSTTEAEKNINDVNKIEIKPNVYSWRNLNIANAHLNSYNYKREYDSHMMKNTEWGAVAYLQHSVYGSRQSVMFNNNSSFITGYSAVNEPTCGYSGKDYRDCNRWEDTSLNQDGIYTKRYNSDIGYKASTTGNITGIYDTAGGAWEYVMGLMLSSDGEPCAGYSSTSTSGFAGVYCGTNGSATGISFPEIKYYDAYLNSAKSNEYYKGILGDATKELGPFQDIIDTYKIASSSWYLNDARFDNELKIFVGRGADFFSGNQAGVFSFTRENGNSFRTFTFRIILNINN